MNRLPNSNVLSVSLIALSIVVGHAQAKPIVYPEKGQSTQQQQKDDGECYAWAKNTTGIDPAAVAVTTTPPPQAPANSVGGERLRGAVRGAAGGAAIGAIAGDTGKGAAIGAVVGQPLKGVRGTCKDLPPPAIHAQTMMEPGRYMSDFVTGVQRYA